MADLIAQRYREFRPLVEILGDRLLFIAAVIVALMGAAMIGLQLIEILAPNAGAFQRI